MSLVFATKGPYGHGGGVMMYDLICFKHTGEREEEGERTKERERERERETEIGRLERVAAKWSP